MGLDGTRIYPLRTSDSNTDNHINLLLYDEHYSLISSFGRLVNSQIANHHGTRFYCYQGLNSFTGKQAREKHEKYCKKHCVTSIDISENPVKFKNSYPSMTVPFVIYADFKSFSIKINICEPNPRQSYMQNIMKQDPSSL
jgi:hypothetical protein